MVVWILAGVAAGTQSGGRESEMSTYEKETSAQSTSEAGKGE